MSRWVSSDPEEMSKQSKKQGVSRVRDRPGKTLETIVKTPWTTTKHLGHLGPKFGEMKWKCHPKPIDSNIFQRGIGQAPTSNQQETSVVLHQLHLGSQSPSTAGHPNADRWVYGGGRDFGQPAGNLDNLGVDATGIGHHVMAMPLSSKVNKRLGIQREWTRKKVIKSGYGYIN